MGREVWTFELVDIHMLYSYEPSLVRMEPNTSAINIAISGGKQIPGLLVSQQLKLGTR